MRLRNLRACASSAACLTARQDFAQLGRTSCREPGFKEETLMSGQSSQVDLQALAQVLTNARMQLDEAAKHLPQGAATRRLQDQTAQLGDNNSGCNTGCACATSEPALAARPA